MNNDNKYNGWTNYATWRINLEFGLCDNPDDFRDHDADMLKSYIEELLEMDCENQATLSYAMAFVSDVNFHEIIEHIREANEAA